MSAGEASGDGYAAELVSALAAVRPDLRFFGCAGPKMVEAGVEPVVHSFAVVVVGLVEVIRHSYPRRVRAWRAWLRSDAFNCRPLISRNTAIVKNAVRLLPSQNG